jgi:hypothetical protein
MPQITKTEITNAGYACDMCGVLISDGAHDGAGDMNWWGVNVGIQPLKEETLTIKRIWNGYKVEFVSKYAPSETWGVCSKCVVRVREFIKARNGNLPLDSTTLLDIQTVVGFVLGNWPGYEDAVQWGDKVRKVDHSFYMAARRLKRGLLKSKTNGGAV